MLTGDKFETAENIGLSCKLIDSDFHVFKMKEADDVVIVCS
jgi:magnesium-transporting ATPase (P-type)